MRLRTSPSPPLGQTPSLPLGQGLARTILPVRNILKTLVEKEDPLPLNMQVLNALPQHFGFEVRMGKIGRKGLSNF